MGWLRKAAYTAIGAKLGPLGALGGFVIACIHDMAAGEEPPKSVFGKSPFEKSIFEGLGPAPKAGGKSGGTPRHGPPVKGMQASDRRAVFLICLLSALAKVAKADGLVSKREIERVEALIKRLNLDAEDTRFAQDVFRKAKDDARYEIADYLRQFVDTLQDQTLNDLMFRALVEVACADGHLEPGEALLIRKAERILLQPLGMGDRIIREMLSQHRSREQQKAPPPRVKTPTVDDYAILGIASTATNDEIRKAWRKKCMELHPDRVQAKGLPPEFIRFANEQLAEVNGAYDRIAKTRGIKQRA